MLNGDLSKTTTGPKAPLPPKAPSKLTRRARLKRAKQVKSSGLEDRLDRRAALIAAGGGSATPDKIIRKADALLAWLQTGRTEA